MRSYILIIFLFITSLSYGSTLKIIVNNLVIEQGCLNLAMYADANAFNNDQTQSAVYIVKQQAFSNTIELVIPGIPNGTYAVKAFQDQNCQGIMERNMLGIPKNIYGFSNQTRSNNFTKAAFVLNNKITQQIINLA